MADPQYNALLESVKSWRNALESGDDEQIEAAKLGLLSRIPTPQVRVPKLDLRGIAQLVPKENMEQAIEIAVLAERAIAFSKDLTVLVKDAGVLSLNDAADKVDVQIAAKEAAEAVEAAAVATPI
jgi:hypothetical protein